MFWKKFFNTPKLKVEFVNIVPGVSDLMPIIPAKEIKHKWVSKAAQSFANYRKEPNWNTHFSRNHTVRCPAIFLTQRTGWVLRAWQDFVIETNGSDVGFTYRYPTEFKKLADPHISWHSTEQYYDFMESWRPDTLHTIIKYHSGWRAYIPSDYFLLEMPVGFSDENRFTVIPGLFDGDQGVFQLNVQMLWHQKNGSTLIKRGTPISQYILIKKTEVDFVCRDAEENEKKLELHQLVDSTQFIRNYKESKNIFKN
jgi:hypothetical protein